ncbi:hypothetical protein QR680_019276 [Steinernema hermaphroditum]|uniref:Uncharacterized protein n=1 Tax=Steinernema hermaphroditum TaxID=289476 RepID=A0AA39LRM1_9BILA|nr:hypothetical protein QR680_019276 [Steinernema hermaphroditum]
MITIMNVVHKISQGDYLLPANLHLSDRLIYWGVLVNFALAFYVSETGARTPPLSCAFAIDYTQSAIEHAQQSCLENNFTLFTVPGMGPVNLLRGVKKCTDDVFGERSFVQGYKHLHMCFCSLGALSIVSILLWKFLFPSSCINVLDTLKKYVESRTTVMPAVSANMVRSIGKDLHSNFLKRKYISNYMLYLVGKVLLGFPLFLLQICIVAHCVSPIIAIGSPGHFEHVRPLHLQWPVSVIKVILGVSSTSGIFPAEAYCVVVNEVKSLDCRPVRCHLNNARSYEIAFAVFVIYNVLSCFVQALHVVTLFSSIFCSRTTVVKMLMAHAFAERPLEVTEQSIYLIADEMGMEGLFLVMIEELMPSMMTIPIQQLCQVAYKKYVGTKTTKGAHLV